MTQNTNHPPEHSDVVNGLEPIPSPNPIELPPVLALLSDSNRWDQERDCSTNKNRVTLPNSPLAVKWSVRAAVEKCYPDDWKVKMRHFMSVAQKHYPGYRYDDLHSVLSYEAMYFILKEANL